MPDNAAIPWLMKAGIVGSAFLSLVFGVSAIAGALGLGMFTYANSPALTGIARGAAIGVLALASVLLGSIAYGYATHRIWARPLGPLFWGLATLFGLAQTRRGSADPVGDWVAACGIAVIFLVSLWYFYRKRRVVTYYRMIGRATNAEQIREAGA